MKKILYIFFLVGYTMSIHADGIVLKDKGDSLSYAWGLTYIAVFAGNTAEYITSYYVCNMKSYH